MSGRKEALHLVSGVKWWLEKDEASG